MISIRTNTQKISPPGGIPVISGMRHKSRVFCLLLLMLSMASWSVHAQSRSARMNDDLGSQHRAVMIDYNGQEVTQLSGPVHPDDSLALVAFYHSMQGEHWVRNEGWLELPVDFWVGIERVINVGDAENPDWRVDRITTERYNMTVPGYFPAEIGNMAYLARFRVQEDLAIGVIPDEVGQLVNLERWLHNANFVTGEIPWAEFRKQPRLDHWTASSNLFYGTGIPDDIGEFPNLSRLDIRDNDLTGTIPASVADITRLQYFRIGNTLITGDLPDMSHLEFLERIQVEGMNLTPGPIWPWLENMTSYEDFEELYIHHTNRTGTIPEWLPGALPALTDFSVGEHYLDAPENAIGGEIPSLVEMTNLERLYFRGPGWTGPIPDWLGDMLALSRLYLYDTKFSGPIPGSLANLNNVERLQFYRNHELTGGLPPEFADLGTITFLIIQNHNGMEIGQLPSWLGNLTSLSDLDLRNTGITGTLPDISGMTNLTTFRVSDNPGLTGDINVDFFADRALSTFDISRTGLNVTEVPSWLNSENSRRNLGFLGLAGLGLTGEIPAWLGDMVWLRRLALDDNALTGSIPGELGNLIQLDSLNLANNQLTGSLDANLANMGRLGGDIVVLENLILSGNAGLTGEIPAGILDADFMRHFMIDGTELCLPEGSASAQFLAMIPDNAFRTYPRKYVGVDANESHCGPVSTEPIYDRPFSFLLHQNYPNPFNPVTTIRYEIPVDGQVTLQVYNVIGQRVATLVNDVQSSGSHEINFDATRLSSGTYIYRLESNGRTMTQSMMLIK